LGRSQRPKTLPRDEEDFSHSALHASLPVAEKHGMDRRVRSEEERRTAALARNHERRQAVPRSSVCCFQCPSAWDDRQVIETSFFLFVSLPPQQQDPAACLLMAVAASRQAPFRPG
jgi:hypothetical protein